MFTWRMEVKDETFTSLRDHPSVGQDYITPDAGVASLDEFSVDGAGNCLEASFRASPKFVDIRARDIVSLEVSEDDGSTWTPVYRGYVVTAGNPRSDDIQGYKLVGLRQRFFEITNTLRFVATADAAEQAEEVFQYIDDEGDWPAGVTQSVPTLPDFGFVNGIRYPQQESYGDTLKAIAESVGRFVVPVGETYTYDGRTYNELETVPAARFGVDASGNVIFGRPQANDAVFSESGDNILAEYTQVTGEEIFDSVELIYANQFVDAGADKVYASNTGSTAIGPCPKININEWVPIPLARTFSFGSTNATRKVVLPAPAALMQNAIVSSTVSIGGSVSNPDGAYTGGATTITSGAVDYDFDSSLALFPDGFIVRFVAESTPGGTPRLVVDSSSNSGIPSPLDTQLIWIFEDNDSLGFIELPLLNLANAEVESSGGTVQNSCYNSVVRRQISLRGEDVVISNLEALVPDIDLNGTKSEQYASGFVRDVQQDVAEVTLVNQLGPVAPRMVWTPEGESSVTVPVERIQYSLTRNDGLITRYELGQAFDAELLSERAVLKGLAREAVSE